MNHQILQDSICLQKEVKILLGAICKGKKSGSMMGLSSNRSIKKRSRHEDSKEIEQVKMKQPVKCWKCGGHHLCRDCPMKEHKEGSNHKVPRLGDEPKSWEIVREGHGRWGAWPLKFKVNDWTWDRSAKFWNFECANGICIPMYWNTGDGDIPRGRGLLLEYNKPTHILRIK